MRHIGILEPEVVIELLNRIGIPVVTLYGLSMFLFPWISGDGDWNYVHSVWHNWQGLNVGMLAFVSSLIAFNIGRYNAERQREREFIAAKVFLPEALSELTEYFKLSAILLSEAYERASEPRNNRRRELAAALPVPPKEYKTIFSRCIEKADPEVGSYLAYILMRLQVHNSRISGIPDSFTVGAQMLVAPQNILTYLFRLAELQALVNNLFEFARGMELFVNEYPRWDDFRNAYGNLDLWLDDYDGLQGFTERAIARHKVVKST
ncbi:MAG: hypothetical protein WD071_16770 [Pseudohongiella sp.]|uniref:hypothetical protein n=1 Tax=Pseudohongiella sp. TaxID=1979412 RepID=UPI0034A068BB